MRTRCIISHLFLLTLSFKTGFAGHVCGPDEIGIGEIQIYPWDNKNERYADGDGLKSAMFSEDCTLLAVSNDGEKCKGGQWSGGYTLTCDDWKSTITSVTTPDKRYYDKCYQYKASDSSTACNVEDASKLSYADVGICCKNSGLIIQQSY